MASYHETSQFTIEANILKGKEVSYSEEYASLGEFILRRLEDNPDVVGQIDAVTDEEYTYEKMRERSVRCALWMRSQGLRPKDVIALCSENHLDFAMPCFAALYLGAIIAPIAVPANAEDCAQNMNIIKPKMVFVGEGSTAFVTEAARRVNPDMKIIVFGRVPGFLEFDSIIAEPEIDEVEKFICTPIKSSDEIAAIHFSSGTTGDPKGVALSHRALTMTMAEAGVLGMTNKVCLRYLATYWISMTKSILRTLWLKIPSILLPPFEETAACAMIQKYRKEILHAIIIPTLHQANWISFTPYMIDKLARCDAAAGFDLSSLSQVVYSGNFLSMTSYRAFKKLVPNAQIISGYGMTETAGAISVQSSKSRPGSCGEIVENAQLKVIDLDNGQILGANQEGELLSKLVCMMTCYYNDPVATAQIMDDDGWIHSGDIGYYTESGEIFLTGRLKDILSYMDFMISPSQFENAILSHPGVKEVAVVGQRQPNKDDLPIAFVVRTENPAYTGDQVTETDILNLVAAKLQDSRKQLFAGVRFVDHLPRTPTDKIKRSILCEMAKLTVTD